MDEVGTKTGKARLLIWDDNAEEIKGLRGLLRPFEANLEIDECTDELTALHKTLTSQYDIALIDINSELFKGRRLQALFDSVPTEVRSAFGDDLQPETMKACNLEDWIEQGFCGLLFLAILRARGCPYRHAFTSHAQNTLLVQALAFDVLDSLGGIIRKTDADLLTFKIRRSIEGTLKAKLIRRGEVPPESARYTVTLLPDGFRDHNDEMRTVMSLRFKVHDLVSGASADVVLHSDDALLFIYLAKHYGKSVSREKLYKAFRKYLYRPDEHEYSRAASDKSSIGSKLTRIRSLLSEACSNLADENPDFWNMQNGGLLRGRKQVPKGVVLAAVCIGFEEISLSVPEGRPESYMAR